LGYIEITTKIGVAGLQPTLFLHTPAVVCLL